MLIVTLNRLKLELAALVDLIAFENVVVEENAADCFFFSFILSVIGEGFQENVNCGQTLLAVDDEIRLNLILFSEFLINDRAGEVMAILLVSLNNISKQLLTLL